MFWVCNQQKISMGHLSLVLLGGRSDNVLSFSLCIHWRPKSHDGLKWCIYSRWDYYGLGFTENTYFCELIHSLGCHWMYAHWHGHHNLNEGKVFNIVFNVGLHGPHSIWSYRLRRRGFLRNISRFMHYHVWICLNVKQHLSLSQDTISFLQESHMTHAWWELHVKRPWEHLP